MKLKLRINKLLNYYLSKIINKKEYKLCRQFNHLTADILLFRYDDHSDAERKEFIYLMDRFKTVALNWIQRAPYRLCYRCKNKCLSTDPSSYCDYCARYRVKHGVWPDVTTEAT